MNENLKQYSEWESDFYQYLSSRESGVNKHSCTNYIAWMKHLSRNYIINNDIDEATIDSIIESESRLQPTRAIYTKRRDLTNFRSCLRKFVQFIHSDYVDAQANLLDKAERQVREQDYYRYRKGGHHQGQSGTRSFSSAIDKDVERLFNHTFRNARRPDGIAHKTLAR